MEVSISTYLAIITTETDKLIRSHESDIYIKSSRLPLTYKILTFASILRQKRTVHLYTIHYAISQQQLETRTPVYIKHKY